MKLEDFAIKMRVILDELEAKIQERPTFKQTRATLSTLEEKYEELTNNLTS